jgi:3-phosphoshikimate 1-carboxyvinyltransferase
MRARPLAIDQLTAPPAARIALPGSKSITNRALVAAALASGRSTLSGALIAEDTLAMIDCLRTLGVSVDVDPTAREIIIEGSAGVLAASGTLWVRQSGTTARFMLPLAALAVGGATVDGDKQIQSRPQDDLVTALQSLGTRVEALGQPGSLPLRISGAPRGDSAVQIPGDVSSQYLSALLLAGPAMGRGLTLELTGDVISRPYITMTLGVMRAFGADVVETDGRNFEVGPGGYAAVDYTVEPDASAASYFFAAAAVSGGTVTVPGLGTASLQGDRGFVDLLGQMGCRVESSAEETTVTGPVALEAIDASMAHVSDTAPTLGAIAPLANGPVRVRDVAFIRKKESDRITAVVTELTRLGVDAVEHADGFTVTPGIPTGTTVQTYDDHRIAMAFTVLGLVTPNVSIADPQCVAKTFPEFFDAVDLLRAAGDADLAVLAIDGPAGSGKSTVARLAADRLGLEYLDTGAMYRSVTLAALTEGIDPADAATVAALARHIEIDVSVDGVFVDSEDVTDAIRTEPVNAAVSLVAANPGVRAAMRRQQRGWARRRGGGVMEGRDIGSVVFPSARLKVYVTASIEERARRRAAEVDASIDDMIEALTERDRKDSARTDSPLTEADDAVIVDTTGLTIDDVVGRITELFDD